MAVATAEQCAQCKIELSRLGKRSVLTAQLVGLLPTGGELFVKTIVPQGQKLRLTFAVDESATLDATITGCKPQNPEGYRLVFQLADEVWPFALYSKLATPSQLAGSLTDAPHCLRVLGLTSGCSLLDVEEAFVRDVRKVHPDRGGSIDDFVRLRTAYLEAMELLGGQR